MTSLVPIRPQPDDTRCKHDRNAPAPGSLRSSENNGKEPNEEEKETNADTAMRTVFQSAAPTTS